MPRFSIALTPTLLALTACASPTTQIVVAIDTDLCVPAELDRIEIVATRGGMTSEVDRDFAAPGPGFPLTASFVRDPANTGPLEVTVTGFLAGSVVVDRRARAEYVLGEERVLRMDLLRSCVGRSCPGETCTFGGCGSIDAELRLLTDDETMGTDAGGCTPPVDGGGIDAGCVCPSDGIDCTIERCDGASCQHLPDDSLCRDLAAGRCDPAVGCVGCDAPGDWCGTECGCDDDNPCTVGDRCDRSGEVPTCASTPLPVGDACPTGPCLDGTCQDIGGVRQCQSVARSCDDPADPCHEHACDPKSDSCVVGDAHADGSTCSDPSWATCVTAGECASGSCAPTEYGPCSVAQPRCQIGHCDPSSGCSVESLDFVPCLSVRAGCTACECMSGVPLDVCPT